MNSIASTTPLQLMLLFLCWSPSDVAGAFVPSGARTHHFGAGISPPQRLSSNNNHHASYPKLGKRHHVQHHRMSSSSSTVGSAELELMDLETILTEEVNKANGAPMNDIDSRLPKFLQEEKDNRALSALQRAVEIGTVLGGQVMAPILSSLATQQNWPTEDNGGWEAFWSITSDGISQAERLALALEELGPTYVKFGQALGSRPDVVPQSLAKALSALQDDMTPFDSEVAKNIIVSELMGKGGNSSVPLHELEVLVSSLTEEPVAAASIGQVYKATLPGRGDVAVKVQRPGVRMLVERDTELLLTVANFLESLPALPSSGSSSAQQQQISNSTETTSSNKPQQKSRLINTQLVSATQEFMSRIFEELDYRNEASNCIAFGKLYSEEYGTSNDVSVVVPKVYLEWCTENVLVMEWIDGTKLTDVPRLAYPNS